MSTDKNAEENKRIPNFAHPAEKSFARILDYYGLKWEYEPRSFPLEWSEDGEIIEAFTPDFYLPEQNLFIELTTLRPKLSTHKNRKLRLLQERYPDIQIRLLKRRDLHQLLVKFGLEEEAAQIQGTRAQRGTE